jgi:uncharacterized RDD family membrane protein YckC
VRFEQIEYCTVCGSAARLHKGRKVIYDHLACQRCWKAFVNRRTLAYAIDLALLWLGTTSLMFLLSVLVSAAGPVTGTVAEAVSFTAWIGGLALFVARDALLEGRSPGKALTGLAVVERVGGRPIGVAASVRRNLVMLVPLVPLLAASQIQRGGTRWGDRWAGTRVIWTAHADRLPFRTTTHTAPTVPSFAR